MGLARISHTHRGLRGAVVPTGQESRAARCGTSGKQLDAQSRHDGTARRVAPRRPPAASRPSSVAKATLFGPLLTGRSSGRDADHGEYEKYGLELSPAIKTSPAAATGRFSSFRRPGLVTCAATIGLIVHGAALANQAYWHFADETQTAALPDGTAETAGTPFAATALSSLSLPASVPAPGSAPAKRAAALTLLDADFQADSAFPDSDRLAYGLRGKQEPAAAAQAEKDLRCLALNIYHEARGESDEGKRAVAHVVMNRVADRRFPDNVCGVIYQGGERKRHRCQFSWWCDGRSDRPMDLASLDATAALAREVYWGLAPDPTDGALWYHAHYVSPYWRSHFTQGPTIGQHIFYNDRKAKPAPSAKQLASR